MTDTPAWVIDTYRAHAGHVFRRARHLLGSEADAHEVVQDIFLSLLEQPDQYQGRSSVTTFLYSVTTHTCLNRIRNQKNRARLLQQSLASSADDAELMTPERRVELHALLSQMPDEWARAAIYHYMDDLTHEDIARIMDCSRRHVGNLLARITAWANTKGQHAD